MTAESINKLPVFSRYENQIKAVSGQNKRKSKYLEYMIRILYTIVPDYKTWSCRLTKIKLHICEKWAEPMPCRPWSGEEEETQPSDSYWWRRQDAGLWSQLPHLFLLPASITADFRIWKGRGKGYVTLVEQDRHLRCVDNKFKCTINEAFSVI